MNKNIKQTIMLLAATALLAGSARAASLTITDASFEYPALSQYATADFSTYSSDPSFAWTYELPYVVYQPRVWNTPGGSGPSSAQDGSQVALIVGTSLFKQTLADTWQANTTYTLKAYMALGQSASSSGLIGLAYGNNPTMTTPFSMALANVAANSGDVAATASWVQTTVTFTTGISDSFLGQNIVVFGQNRIVDGGNNMIFDNFTLDATPVPEPSTLALAGIGGLAMMLLLRRKA